MANHQDAATCLVFNITGGLISTGRWGFLSSDLVVRALTRFSAVDRRSAQKWTEGWSKPVDWHWSPATRSRERLLQLIEDFWANARSLEAPVRGRHRVVVQILHPIYNKRIWATRIAAIEHFYRVKFLGKRRACGLLDIRNPRRRFATVESEFWAGLDRPETPK